MRGSAALLLLALVGCVPRADVERRQGYAGLVGRGEADVVRRLGPADDRFAQGPLTTLVYVRRDVEAVGGAGFVRPRTAGFECRLTFTLEAGRVRSFDERGGGC